MCDDEFVDSYESGYGAGQADGYYDGRESRDWEIEDFQEEIAQLHLLLADEQAKVTRLGVALLATGLPSHFVDAIAKG